MIQNKLTIQECKKYLPGDLQEEKILQIRDFLYKQVWNNHKNLNKNFVSNMEGQIKKLLDKKNKMADLLIDGILTKEMYKMK